MISRFRFWYRFKKLIFGCFAIVSGAITCCFLGSWTIDPQGNLVGENVLDSSNYSIVTTSNVYTYNATFHYDDNYYEFVSNGTYSRICLQLTSDIQIGQTYTISYDYNTSVYVGNTNFCYIANYDSVYGYSFYQNGVSFATSTGHRVSTFTCNTSSTNLYLAIYLDLGDFSNGKLIISNIMINKGSTEKSWEPYGVWYSQENYDIANDNKNSFYYNTFNGSKSLIYPQGTTWYQQGSISQLYNAYMNEPTTAELPYTYSLSRTDTSFIMKSYPTTEDETDLLSDNPRGTILFIPNTYISYPIYVGLNDITFNYRLQVLYLDNTSLVIDTDNLQPHLYIAKVDSSFDNPIIAISYDYYYEDYFLNTKISIDTAGLNINDYYQRGYDSAKSYYGATVQQQLRDIEELNNQINTLNNTIDSWISRYNDLASQSTELSMRNLMWYIASTPFESFKSIWNVDFLGLNISAFFTGMFSIFIIIWILKKIF